MLAREMGRTLEELGEAMSSAEFRDHWEDWLYEPWGDKRADIQAAVISQTVATFAGKTLEKGVTLPLKDFLVDFNREEEPEEESDPNKFFSLFMK